MAFTKKGLNGNLWAIRMAKAQDDLDIAPALKERVDKFKRENESTDELIDKNLTEGFSARRRLVAPRDYKLDVEVVTKLFHLFKEEQKMSKTMLEVLNFRCKEDESLEFDEAMMHRVAVRAKIGDNVEELAAKLAGTRLQHGLDVKSSSLFQDFFEICQIPNEAEVQLLAEASGRHEREVLAWFEMKRERLFPYYVMRKVLQNDENGPTPFQMFQYIGKVEGLSERYRNFPYEKVYEVKQ
ncbi:MAG: hypothetical protein M1833_007020 [Piccolia ochrophora]|nr:MAG: hypothetical protein M1833_007020 [Piccolia ochrophora]